MMTITFLNEGVQDSIDVREDEDIHQMAKEVHRIICERCPHMSEKTYFLSEICYRLLPALSEDGNVNLEDLTV